MAMHETDILAEKLNEKILDRDDLPNATERLKQEVQQLDDKFDISDYQKFLDERREVIHPAMKGLADDAEDIKDDLEDIQELKESDQFERDKKNMERFFNEYWMPLWNLMKRYQKLSTEAVAVAYGNEKAINKVEGLVDQKELIQMQVDYSDKLNELFTKKDDMSEDIADGIVRGVQRSVIESKIPDIIQEVESRVDVDEEEVEKLREEKTELQNQLQDLQSQVDLLKSHVNGGSLEGTQVGAGEEEEEGYEQRCSQCGYEWTSEKEDGPRQCPECNSRKWDEEPDDEGSEQSS